jgi:hypothetical protein
MFIFETTIQPMRKIYLSAAILLSVYATQAQGLKGVLKKATAKDSTGKSALSKILSKDSSGLTTTDVVNGLKEALSVGAERSTSKLSAVNGFFGNAALKILMPPEAVKVENTLRKAGFGNQVDEAILSMNRAAEDAAKSAAPIFINAVKGMSINDAWGILKGSDTAATSYLKTKTTSPLTEAFRPVIESSLGKVGATKYWNTLFTTYNKLPLTSKVNPDLSAYVTEKALYGIFLQLAAEEKTIRKDPLAQTTSLLQKVFGSKS